MVNAQQAIQLMNPKLKTVEQTIEMIKLNKQQVPPQNSPPKRMNRSMGFIPYQNMMNYEEPLKFITTETNLPSESITDFDFYFFKGIFRHRFITTLPAGCMFGELGILMNKGRAASIVAAQDTQLALLSAKYYKQILQDIELKKVQARIQFFTNHFFHKMPLFMVMKYSYNFEKLKLVRGEAVYQQESHPSHVYLIRKGEIQFVKKQIINHNQSQTFLLSPHKTKQLPLYEIGLGEIFGELEIIQDCKRLNTAICLSDRAKLYFLSSEIFQRLLRDNPNMKENFVSQGKSKKHFEEERMIFLIKAQKLNTQQLTKHVSVEVYDFDKTDHEINQLTQQSHKIIAKKIQQKVQQKLQILKLKGVQGSDSTKQFVRLFGRDKHNSKEDQFYKLPTDIKQKLIKSQNMMDRFRNLYNNSQIQGQSLNGMKDFDDFKNKFSQDAIKRNDQSGLMMTDQNSLQGYIGQSMQSLEAREVLQTKNSYFHTKCSASSVKSLVKVQRDANFMHIRQRQQSNQTYDYTFDGLEQTTRQNEQTQNSQMQPTIKSLMKINQLSQQDQSLLQPLSVQDLRHRRSSSAVVLPKRKSQITVIPSKHNLFRPKPTRQYLIDSAYRKYKYDQN